MGKLQAFADLKRLPIEFLAKNNIEETDAGIRFTNGNARARIREDADSAHPTYWAKDFDKPMRVYGYDRVERMTRNGKTLLICEGESDSLSAWFHDRPALGVPGASMHGTLELEDVAPFERVVVIREPGDAGTLFAINVPKRLRDLGYCGAIFVADLPTKDLCDLHVQYADDAAEFDRVLDTAIDGAKPAQIPADTQTRKAPRVVHLVSADSIEPVETDYIVRPYIPRGEATWLEGVTKTGKTMVALDIIARITMGKPFVNGEPIERGNVAIITCEDDPARTLVPRLIAAGADRERVSFVQVREGEEERHIAFLADLTAIEERLHTANVSLVFVDGTFGVLGVKDATSYTEAYDAMLPFVAMVRRLNVGVIIVRHVRKSAGSALDKGIGSVGFGALARSTLVVAIDRDDDARRVFAHAGCNVGPIGESYSFTIEATRIEGFAYPVGRAAWGEQVAISADEAVAPRNVEENGARFEAEEFLGVFLNGPKPASEVQAEAKRRGLSFRTVQRAARHLGVEFERRGFGEGSLWIPPERPIHDTIAHSRQGGNAVANGANVSRMAELCDHGKLCRSCKTLDRCFDCGDGTWLCRACAEKPESKA